MILKDLQPLAVAIDELELLPGNPRRGDIDAVAASLEEFGQRKPIVARLVDRTVIAGNHTLQAARRLGWSEIAVVWVEDDDAHAKAFALADNRTAELGSYDDEALLRLIEEVKIEDAELLDAAGWDEQSVLDLISELDVELDVAGGDDIDSLPSSVPSISVLGDVWLLGDHRLMCGDATSPTDVAKLLDGELADMVWTDPPYNVAVEGKAGAIMNDDMDRDEFADLISQSMLSCFEALKPGGSIYVAHSESERMPFGNAFVNAGFHLASCLIWMKSSMTLSRSDYQWRHEPILFGWKPGGKHQWHGRRKQTTIADEPSVDAVLVDDGVQITAGGHVFVVSGSDLQVTILETTVQQYAKPSSSDLHPTMKPVGLVQRHLRNSSQEGNTVFDPFGGSGSTLIAAQLERRKARLMELDPKFVDVICRRWQDVTGELPINEATGNPRDFTKD